MRTAALLAACVLAAGCISSGRTFLPAGGVQRLGPSSIELPSGWLRVDGKGELSATRDGYALQAISVSGREPSVPGILPVEQAERAAAYQRWRLRDCVVVSQRPATLSAVAGFRNEVRFLDEEGAAYHLVSIGALISGQYWTVSYVAPERHYFAQDLPAFERAVQSFRVDGDR